MSDKKGEVTAIDRKTAERANRTFGSTPEGRIMLSLGETKDSLGTKILDMVEDNITLEEDNNKLQGIASTDQLTNLSRKEELEKFLSEHLDKNQPVTLLFFDIDHFKEVNDTQGHLVGDKVLQVMGDRLNNTFPKSAGNFLCRYGGEEFVVVMVGLNDEKVGLKRAEQFRELMDKNPIAVTTGTGERVVLNKTVSAGVAVKDPDLTFDQWINEADRALYYAKETGRNKVITLSQVPADFKR